MKLATMKIVCLLALLGGVFMLGLIFDVSYAQFAHDRVLEYWPRQAGDELNLRMPGVICGSLLILIGLYGFLPKLPSARNTTITFKGANGDITLQLRPIRKVLLKMMRRMPEVYSIKLNVRPDSDGRRAFIDADVVLKNCAALGARQSAKIVAECLATTARGLLGLEDISAVRLNVAGIRVDVAAAGKQIREHLMLRQAEEASAYAVAHPPIAAVTLDNNEVVAAENQVAETCEAESASPQPNDACLPDEQTTPEESEEYEQEPEVEQEPESDREPEPVQEPEVAQESEKDWESEPAQESAGKQTASTPQAPEYESEREYAETPMPAETQSCDYVEPQSVVLGDVEPLPQVDREAPLPSAPYADDYEPAAEELNGGQPDMEADAEEHYRE